MENVGKYRVQKVHTVKLPIIDQIIFNDEARYQCEVCGWTGTESKRRYEGSALVIICPKCGNEAYFDDLLEWKIYLIPKVIVKETPSVGLTNQSRDILAVYQQRLAVFKREMEALGIKVKVTASLGKWISTVEV